MAADPAELTVVDAAAWRAWLGDHHGEPVGVWLVLFEILTSQNRYAILHRLDAAKRAETRARRLEKFVARLALGQTIYPQKRGLDNHPEPAGGSRAGGGAEGGRAEGGLADG